MTNRPTTHPHIPEHETSFRLMFERSADAIFLLDPSAQLFVECNSAAMALLRAKDKSQILMASPASLSPEFQPDGSPSREKSIAMTDQVLVRGTHRFEWMTRRFDGTELWIEVSLTAIQPGENPLVAVTCRDVSERKRMEVELRLFEQMPFSIQLFAPDGTTRQINRAYEELFLMKMEDLKGFNIRTDSQVAAAGIAPLVERAFNGEIVDVPPIRFQLRIGDGEASRGERWIGSTLFPLQDAEGRLLEVVCVHEDVSERKRSEDEIRSINATLEQRIAERTAELKASEARWRTILEHAPEAIVVFDGETGNFLTANQNALDLYGCSAEQLSQLSPADYKWPRGATQVHCLRISR